MFAYVGLPQNLKDLKDPEAFVPYPGPPLPEIISRIPEGRSREMNSGGLGDISQKFADFAEICRFF